MNKEILISSLWMQNNFQYDPLEMPVMSREGFAKAAEAIRKQALEDALAKVREAREGQHKYHGWGEEFFEGFDSGIDDAALAVQSLISD